MENSKEIKPFDPQDIMEGVKSKIKASFVELIPEEQWNAMVLKEVNDFFLPKDINNYNNSRQYVSNLGLMVNSELRKFAEEKIQEYLKSPEFQSNEWKNGQEQISKGLEKILIENTGQIFTELIGSIFQMKMSQMRTY